MTDKNRFYPVSEPVFAGNEKKYLAECIDSGWISSEGSFVKRFETGFAAYTGVDFGIAVSSGTAALETALFALGVGRGDEVIMPAFTIISCALACIRLGAKPVLVDIDPGIWTMDAGLVEEKITDRTKVIMPVHMYGHPVDMDEIIKLREKHGVLIVEDAAQAHGAEYFSSMDDKWYKCGAMGDIAATSFYANKIITTGEGGMVLTKQDSCAERAVSYRNLAFGAENRFHHEEHGYNFRMTNLQAAVGVAQLENIDAFIAGKRKVAGFYRNCLSGISGIRFMTERDWARPVYWMCSVMMDPESGLTADEMIKRLKDHDIQARPFFSGLHRQPVMLKEGLFPNESYPNTERAEKYGFYLPSSPVLEEADIIGIVDVMKAVM